MSQSRVTNEWILDRFDSIYPAYRFAFARLLVQLRADFDGDLDAMLVLLTLSLGTDRKDWARSLLVEFQPAPQMRLTNTQSIAHASGIPRETVRRKLETLERRGWVFRDAEGNWVPTRTASEDLIDSTRESVSFIRAVVVTALAADADPSNEGPSTT